MRSAVRVRALILASALVAGVLLIAAPLASAARYDLGVGDSPLFPAAESAPLHAAASRVVIDPARPLSQYDAHIAAHRAVGQLPQIAVGGTGTKNHRSTKNVVQTAGAAARRWAPARRKTPAENKDRHTRGAPPPPPLGAGLQRLGRQRARHGGGLRLRL